MPTEPIDSPATRRTAVVFFALFLALQLGIPTVQLFQPRPARFGWQMYSSLNWQGIYLVELAQGGIDTVEVQKYVLKLRPEVSWPQILPPHLCASLPGAVAVAYHPPDDAEPETWRCAT